MRLIPCLLVLSTLTLLKGFPANAEPRIALVVGNSSYEHISALRNPVNDAALVASTLTDLGFQVTLARDGDLSALRNSILQFGQELRAAGPEATGLFYYAGHAVQSFGTNYLLPTDTNLADAADLDIVAIEASAILRQMSSAFNRTNIVILDACRNNPFRDLPDFASNGLAEMDAPTGTFLSYATEPGNVAYDGIGSNSAFTSAIVKEISKPGALIEQAFKQARIAVLQQTGGLQTPWETSSLTVDFYFAAPLKLTGDALVQSQLWETVEQSKNPVELMLFLRAYPQSEMADKARALLEETVSADDALMEPRQEMLPDSDEITAFEEAISIGTIEGLQAYLTAYPDNHFTEAALKQLTALRNEEEGMTLPSQAATMALQEGITFNSLLETGAEGTDGFSIAQLIRGSPVYPPIADLPESYWKAEACSNCHNWTRDGLCTQSHVYLGQLDDHSLMKEHPYGGSFKRVLRSWAAGGCK